MSSSRRLSLKDGLPVFLEAKVMTAVAAGSEIYSAEKENTGVSSGVVVGATIGGACLVVLGMYYSMRVPSASDSDEIETETE